MISQKEREKLAWHAIREAVFIEEQGFQNEFDDIDKIAQHFVLYSEEEAIGCGRCYPDSLNSTIWHIGRIAILKNYRKCGYGRTILAALEIQAQDLGATTIRLSAQQQAIAFYEKCGYQIIGDVYMDEHVPHQCMQKKL